MLDKDLEHTLNAAYKEARDQRHEFITVEHLLMALLANASASRVLRACGANLNVLHNDLAKFFVNSKSLDAAAQTLGDLPFKSRIRVNDVPLFCHCRSVIRQILGYLKNLKIRSTPRRNAKSTKPR